jgi:hypothetical protein
MMMISKCTYVLTASEIMPKVAFHIGCGMRILIQYDATVTGTYESPMAAKVTLQYQTL